MNGIADPIGMAMQVNGKFGSQLAVATPEYNLTAPEDESIRREHARL